MPTIPLQNLIVPKKPNLDQAVAEAVALLQMVAQFQSDLDRAGLAKNFPAGARICDRHGDLMKEWQDCTALTTTNHKALMFSIYQRCRALINPVQSALQTLLRPRGTPITLPASTDWSVAPEQILAKIVAAKEGWAYIDSHPQVAIARASA